jgi:fatty-acyl-CoA synthase
MKLDKSRLRREAWRAGPVVWRPSKGEVLRPLGPDDRRRLDRLLP